MPQGAFGERLRELRRSQGGRGIEEQSGSGASSGLGSRSAATSPGADQAPESSTLDTLNSLLSDLGIGAAKGVGNTVFGLGDLVHRTPVLGNLTDALAKLVGPEGTNPDAAFAQEPDILKPTNTTQSIGRGAEQLGEFFLPSANTAKLAAVKQLVKLIPNAANPATMAKLNKLAAFLGRTGGEAAHATGVAAAQGAAAPENAGMTAGGVTAASELGSPMLAKGLTSPLGRKIAPVLAASSGMSALGTGGLGLGASMGMYGLLRRPVEQALAKPGVKRLIESGARQVGKGAARASASAVEGPRPKRKRLSEGSSSR